MQRSILVFITICLFFSLSFLAQANPLRIVSENIDLKVQSKDLEIEKTAKRNIRVEKIEIDIEADGLSEELQTLIREKVEGLEKQADKYLADVELETDKQSEDALEKILENILVHKMPGFWVKTRFIWARTTKLIISLQPETETVKQVEVEIDSRDIPQIILTGQERKLESKCKMIIGVPVVFLENYLPEIEAKVQEELDKDPLLKKMGLKVDPQFYIGETTRVELKVVASRFSLGAEGTIDLGVGASERSQIKMHLGYYPHRKNEIYLEPVFYPHSVEFQLKIGYDYSLDEYNNLGYFYNASKKESTIKYQYEYKKRRWRLEYNLDGEKNKRWLSSYRHPLQKHLYIELYSDLDHKTWFAFTTEL